MFILGLNLLTDSQILLNHFKTSLNQRSACSIVKIFYKKGVASSARYGKQRKISLGIF